VKTQTDEDNQTPPDYNNVAIRAYEIWEASGCPANAELQHWLQAETELAAARQNPSHVDRIDPQTRI
jgi:hypothetical protein